MKYCTCDLFALCLVKQCFIPSPLQCWLHWRYLLSLPWGLHLRKIYFHACLHFPPLLPPLPFSLPVLEAVASPRRQAQGAPPARLPTSAVHCSYSSAGRMVIVVLQCGEIFISCWFIVRCGVSSILKLGCVSICMKTSIWKRCDRLDAWLRCTITKNVTYWHSSL